MKTEDAIKKICPMLNSNCILEKCMFWNITVNGKKEVDRVTEPYDMTPTDISRWVDNKERKGYVNIGRVNGFRDVYVKYIEANEGYCNFLKDN